MNLLLFCRDCISAFIEKVQIQIFFATQQAANKWLGYKFCASLYGGALLYIGDKLNTGNFYFIKDEYYNRFPNCGLMGNKDSDEAGVHGRPCCYCFEMDGYFWMVPISSKTEKYKRIYEEKKKRYKEYDGLRFGYVNGQYRAFLIQNVCPVSKEHIDCQYMIENNTVPVTINDKLSAEINGIVRKVIRLNKRGVRIVLTNINHILNELNKTK